MNEGLGELMCRRHFFMVMKNHCDNIVWRMMAVYAKITRFVYEDTKFF